MGGTPGAPPPWTLSAWRHQFEKRPHSWTFTSTPPPLDIARVTSSIWKTPPLLDIHKHPPPPLDIARVTSSTYSKGGTKLLKGGTKLLKGGTKLLKGGTKLLKGGTKLLKGGTKLLKGGTKSLGWATGGGGVVRPPRPPPPPPPGYGPANQQTKAGLMFCFCFLAGWGHSTETRPGANVLLCCLCNNTSSKELLLHKHCHEDGLSCWHGLTPLLTNCCTNICLTTERQVSNLAGPGPHMAHFQPVTSWMWDSHPAHRTWTTCKLLFYTSWSWFQSSILS